MGLDEPVARFGNFHGQEDAGAEVDGFHFGEILGEEVGDFSEGGGDGRGEVGGGEGVGNGAVVRFRAVDEFDDAVDEVAELGEEFGIVALDEGSPFELCVTCFRSVLHEIITPDIGWDASIFCVVAEDTDTTRFTEFTILVVEVLCGREMVEHGPIIARAHLATGEDDGVKGDIVLSQELIESHVFWVVPPLFPFCRVICGN